MACVHSGCAGCRRRLSGKTWAPTCTICLFVTFRALGLKDRHCGLTEFLPAVFPRVLSYSCLVGHSCRGHARRVQCTDSGPVVIYGPPTSLLPSGDGTSRRGPSEGTWRRRWAGATSSRGTIGPEVHSMYPYPTYGGVGTASGGLQGARRLAYDPGIADLYQIRKRVTAVVVIGTLR